MVLHISYMYDEKQVCGWNMSSVSHRLLLIYLPCEDGSIWCVFAERKSLYALLFMSQNPEFCIAI